jgi:hypothetical protein
MGLVVPIGRLVLAASLALMTVACGGAAGGGDVQVAETRADGEDLDADDEAASEFLSGKLMEHYVKTGAGWTTQFEQYNVLGQVMPDRVPVELFRQHRELAFTIDRKPLTEAMKLNGTDYRAEATFKDSPVRYYHTEEGYEWPQGWANWQDHRFMFTTIAIERRNGQWLLSDDELFGGIKPTAQIPD